MTKSTTNENDYENYSTYAVVLCILFAFLGGIFAQSFETDKWKAAALQGEEIMIEQNKTTSRCVETLSSCVGNFSEAIAELPSLNCKITVNGVVLPPKHSACIQHRFFVSTDWLIEKGVMGEGY